ncbi:MAG: hypothetical protein KAH22_05575 [Thiotrichaceae bacterium]|nr:hypothetical protein [Thiotrichaceae bacterium]
MNNLISLDSLTDIVSNSVGILIIFAVINLIHDDSKTYQLEIPIEHATELKPIFFIAKGDRILPINMTKIFESTTVQITQGMSENKRIFPLDYFGLYGQVDSKENSGISFHVHDISQWSKTQALEKNTSALHKSITHIDPKTQFAYFFVYDSDDETASNGFEAFRQARKYLKKYHIKTGWQPVSAENPMIICDEAFNESCTYLPAYLGKDTP